MAASTEISGGDHSVELVVCEEPASQPDGVNGDGGSSLSEDITPLLKPAEKPKISIFSVSYSRRKSKTEQVLKLQETETHSVTQFISWVWNGSRISGLLCVAFSSVMYFVMEVLADIFTPRSIPLFETAFARCTITLALSYLWLRRAGKPIFRPAQARKFLFSRSLTGCLSLLSFVYCVQRLPLSQAIVLSFTTPIIASIVARIMLHEKLKIADLGGLACSFFGVLFIFRHIFITQEMLLRSGEANYTASKGSHYVYAVLVGIVSSVSGGISYCLIKAGANASEEPVATVFSFGILASPVTAICIFAFEDYVLPDFSSSLLMLLHGTLAFIAEVFLARGLQLEKTSKAVNVLYVQVALYQLWGFGSLRVAPSFGGIVGCLLILISVCYTMYIGPDKETE